MKKKLLLINFLLLTFGSIISANKAEARTNYKVSRDDAEQIKFGPQVGLAILSRRAGIFGEYEINEKLSMQIALSYFRNLYLLDSTNIDNELGTIIKSGSISMPIILRIYPGSDRQFCWFMGAQLGYVIAGEYLFLDENIVDFIKDSEKFKNTLLKGDFIKLKELKGEAETRKFQFGIVTGFDYEFNFGLILGLTYTKDFIDVLKSKESHANWTFQPTLGYNFGKLL